MPYRLPRNLSADGSRVFFETSERLVSGDSNGVLDVYVWEDGQVDLISTGRGSEASELIDMSASGDDVFFTTRERLSVMDCDDQMDVYDARVNGGFASLEPPGPCGEDESCQGELCQGSPSGQPLFPMPRTTVPGRGDVNLGKRVAFSPKRLSARQRTRLAAGRAVVLRVRLNRGARVTATGTARIGKRVRRVLSASKRAARPGVLRLRLRLSARALAQLDRRGSLALSLVIRATGAPEPRAFSMRLGSTRGGRR
jgi:hypothetical protein